MLVKVRATRMGHYDHRRYREGQTFMMKEDDFHAPGSNKTCTWVEAIDGYEVSQETGKVIEKKRGGRPAKQVAA